MYRFAKGHRRGGSKAVGDSEKVVKLLWRCVDGALSLNFKANPSIEEGAAKLLRLPMLTLGEQILCAHRQLMRQKMDDVQRKSKRADLGPGQLSEIVSIKGHASLDTGLSTNWVVTVEWQALEGITLEKGLMRAYWHELGLVMFVTAEMDEVHHRVNRGHLNLEQARTYWLETRRRVLYPVHGCALISTISCSLDASEHLHLLGDLGPNVKLSALPLTNHALIKHACLKFSSDVPGREDRSK
jgi:hypothetical protein